MPKGKGKRGRRKGGAWGIRMKKRRIVFDSQIIRPRHSPTEPALHQEGYLEIGLMEYDPNLHAVFNSIQRIINNILKTLWLRMFFIWVGNPYILLFFILKTIVALKRQDPPPQL